MYVATNINWIEWFWRTKKSAFIIRVPTWGNSEITSKVASLWLLES